MTVSIERINNIMFFYKHRRITALFALLTAALSVCLAACSHIEEPKVSAPPAEMTDDPPESAESPAPETEAVSQPVPEPETPRWPGVMPAEAPAGDDFFADAAFIGNSLMVGFEAYSGITTGDYFATVSASVFSAQPLLAGLYEKSYGKVYVLLGINEIGGDSEVFREAYSAMISEIQAAQPSADIYILALTPVTAAKSESDDFFNMTRIWMYNGILYEIASEMNCYFLDLCSALADETGFLPSYASSDGVHFTPDYYSVWLEHLRTHYIPRWMPLPAETPIDIPADVPISLPSALPDAPPADAPAQIPADAPAQ